MRIIQNMVNALVLFSIVLLSTGCSNNKLTPNRKDVHTKPYELKITPIIGSRQDDAKVIMDMGKIMKVWIAPYKNEGVFVSSHDNYVVAKEADFVLGETVPQKNWKAMKTPTNNIPFQFRDADLDQSSKLEEEEIVKYNNNVYEQQNSENVANERIKEADIYDEEIKAFLEK